MWVRVAFGSFSGSSVLRIQPLLTLCRIAVMRLLPEVRRNRLGYPDNFGRDRCCRRSLLNVRTAFSDVRKNDTMILRVILYFSLTLIF